MKIDDEIKIICRFCYPPDKYRILYESDHFYVMVSLGAIVEGYLLLISKEHFESCAQISAQLRIEFYNIIDRIKAILKNQYGSCVFFEHGRSTSCLKVPDESGSKHCYHAHLHCVPVPFNLNEQITGYPMVFNVRSPSEYFELCEKINLPYLFVWDEKMKLYFIETEIRRQYLRFLVAQGVGKPELWDWLSFPETGTIERTIRQLKSFF